MSRLGDVEFVDRYTGTVHENKPWLRGCTGPCEAMGYYPTSDPSKWPDGAEPDEIGYVFVMCQECNGTGTVSRWVAFTRLPKLFSSWWSFMRGTSGPEDDRWFTIKWAMKHFPRDLVRTFTWDLPKPKERENP